MSTGFGAALEQIPYGQDALQAPSALPRLEIIDPITLTGEPSARRFLVSGLIPMRAVTLLTGDGGIGKSLLGLQLQVACALGRLWIGQPVQPVKSLGFYCEDEPDEIWRRLLPIARHYDSGLLDLELMRYIARAGEDSLLAIAAHQYAEITPTPLFDKLRSTVQELGIQLLVLDTAADIFGGFENSRPQVRGFIALLQRLALTIDGAIVLMAHPSRDGLKSGEGYSGSTAWHNSVRARAYLKSGEGADRRVLECMKSNYGPPNGRIELVWQDGVLIHDAPASGIFRKLENNETERRVLAGFERLKRRQARLSPSRSAANYVVKELLKTPECGGLRRAEIERTYDRLLDGGALAIKPAGPPSTGRQHVVLSPEASL